MLKYLIAAIFFASSFAAHADLSQENGSETPILNERILLTQTQEWTWAVFWQQKLTDFIHQMDPSQIPDILEDPEHPLTVTAKKRNQTFLAALQKVHQSPEGEKLNWENVEHKNYLKKLFSQYLPLLEKEAGYNLIEQDFKQQ